MTYFGQYTLNLGSSAARRGGSTPFTRTES